MVHMTVNRDTNPATHFGRQMRKERMARGWSLREFAARTGVDFSHLSRIENGRRPPNEKVAAACDRVFPERRGWFMEYYEESKSWTPAGLRNWAEYEDKAVSIRVWSPGVVDGFLQTEDYARALLSTVPGVTDEMVTSRLRSRMERQRRVLLRDDPPAAWFVVDELSLYRLVGSSEVMAVQMRHLAEVASLPNVTMQILPAVAHPANASELIVTDNAVFVEHLVGGLVYTEDETVSSLQRLFYTILSESDRASESLATIVEVGEQWIGGSPAFQARKAGRA
jgi:transcriptional regulator with XRE-family HTH domain